MEAGRDAGSGMVISSSSISLSSRLFEKRGRGRFLNGSRNGRFDSSARGFGGVAVAGESLDSSKVSSEVRKTRFVNDLRGTKRPPRASVSGVFGAEFGVGLARPFRKRVEPGFRLIEGREGLVGSSDSSGGFLAKSLESGLEKPGLALEGSFAVGSGASSDWAWEEPPQQVTRRRTAIRHPGRLHGRTSGIPTSDIDHLHEFFYCEGARAATLEQPGVLSGARGLRIVVSGLGREKLKRIGRSCGLFRKRGPCVRYCYTLINQQQQNETSIFSPWNLRSSHVDSQAVFLGLSNFLP